MHGGRKNVPYLPDEEEEEDDVAEVEQGQERGKVTVRKLPKAVSQVNWVQNGLMVVGEGAAYGQPGGQHVPVLATSCQPNLGHSGPSEHRQKDQSSSHGR